ncbi:TonB-dependent receptor [Saccharobesus litoralis]|uniref:TonB-dependent receptor n=1 Tax=Saccharobesus litoralis TaxID=2172099 RepID=A0A2S0VLP2_9ALTE|nr:TonB-dependent receptor [Saccharobesus litoralis]AWB65128.1 TonB-dependent receptor [Saccharobesus litoralis]
MSNTRERFKLSALSLAILASSASMVAYAAEEEDKEKKKDKEDTEVIEVTGFRGSVLKSINQKKFSNNISDSIFAEDIGKSTDQNIADALSRVTGVSVQERDGEGTVITVRGANPNQNVITLNGVTLTSADDNQSVDLSAFSSDILSQISVIKAPSADHIEGALGATVQLNTFKPLNRKETLAAEVQYRNSDFADKDDYKISASISKKFFDDTFGVFATIANETSSSRRDQIRIDDYKVVNAKVAGTTENGVVSDTLVLAPNTLNYDLYTNESDRVSGTLTFQLAPTESTNILLNFTGSEQNLTNQSYGVQTRGKYEANNANFFAGDKHGLKVAGKEFYPSYSDPQEDWWIVDTGTRTLVKSLNRFGDGGYNTNAGGSKVKNSIVNLHLEQYIGDEIKVDAGIDYSKTTQDPTTRAYYFNMLSGVSQDALIAADPFGTPVTGIQPVGFDCSSGTCLMEVGTSVVSHEDRLNLWDNIRTTGFNPNDTAANRYNFLSVTEREVDDEIKGAFIDIDWDLDVLGFTKLELGARVTKREKYVDHQSGQLKNSSDGEFVNIYDSHGNIIGSRIITTGESLSAVPSENYIIDQPFPYNDFLVSSGVPMSPTTAGFPQVDIEKFIDIVSSKDPVFQRNKGDTRGAVLDNKAAYVKLNFNPIENLTGDIGLRYVKTEVESSGYSSVRWPQDDYNRAFDPFLFRHLRTPELLDGMTEKETCANTNAVHTDPNSKPWFNRIDGYGWDFNGTPDDPTDDTRIPSENTYPCYDPLTIKDNAGNHGSWARHTDWSHLRDYYSYAESITDEQGIERPAGGKEDRSISTFATVGSHSYSNLLPSLNMNMAFTDEFIGRFAASKTMSHPKIDSIKPGFEMHHGYWGVPENGNTRGARIDLSNPKLNPQESKNLDVSLEWYFNKESMMSLGLFHKELTDFEERVETIQHASDLRFLDLSNGYDAADLVKSKEDIKAEWEADPSMLWGNRTNACAPNIGSIYAVNQPWWYAADDADQTEDPGGRNAMAESYCSLFKVSKLRNGKGATISGLEFGYRQAYTFLPGIWSGLGVDFNYTYSNSKTDKEIDTDTGAELPQFPVEWVPQHAYNFTGYWQKFGHSIRLAYRGKSDELVSRSDTLGASWREGSGRLDLSANYKINETFSLSFQALNLTDTETRNYYTSVHNVLDYDEEGNDIKFSEGNALKENVTKDRTLVSYRNGRTYRLSLRANF